MREGHCGPKFAWAFGMRPENFGFDPGAFWAGRGRSRGGPFGGARMFDQGHLKFVILRLLDEKPRHGYEIGQLIELRSRGVLHFNVGSLYPLLYRLEHRGWIEAEWKVSELGRRAKYYRLTASGRKQLTIEAREWDRMQKAISRVMRLA